ncbi:MAG: MFS transporter [Chloroflexi bacterium]|nr:MFS transporter [Chloroflexota bacterium]
MNQTDDQFTVRDLLRIANFRKLWLGQIVSNFGDALTHLTLVLVINQLTGGSTTSIAGLLIALALPQATIGLMAGVFVDRMDRKRTMIVSDLLRGVLVFGFIFTVLDDSANMLWLIYVIAFLHSAIGSFFAPARSALIPNVVPEKGLLAANSLSQMSVVLFRVVGTAVAGIIIGVLDNFWLAFVIDGTTFFLSIVFIAQVTVKSLPRPTESATVKIIADQMKTGLKIIAGSRVLVGIMIGIAITMLGLGAVNVLLAPMIVNDLNVSETWFGAIEFAQTAAMVLSGASVAALAAKIKPTNIISVSLIATGIMIIPMAFITQVWHLFPILFIVGLAITPLNASVSTLAQTAVSDNLRGRVSAALNAVIQSASLISMFAAGAVAAVVGVRSVFVISGIIAIVAGLVTVWIFYGYRAPAPTPLQAAMPSTVAEQAA